MKNQIVILFFSFFLTLSTFAQRKEKSVEVGLFLGGSYYIGDLNPTRHFSQFTKPAAGALIRYNFSHRLSARGSAFYGNMEAHDAFSSSPYQQQRNLNFRSSILEASVQLEFNFLNYEIGNDKERFSPYIFGGLGGFTFNPEGEYKDEWIRLRPLSTEGQGLAGSTAKTYQLFQISLPFGVGVRVNLAKNLALSMEWGMRKTFTDYLDDVSTRYYDPTELEAAKGQLSVFLADKDKSNDTGYSNVGRQRGNPTTKDWYSFAGVALTVKLKGRREKCPGVKG